MKNILLIGCLILSPFILIAQKVDDKIYESCQTSLDKDNVGVITRDSNIIFDSCPQFRNGEFGFNKFLRTNLHYPKTNSDVVGKVWLKMVIEKDGRVTNVQVIRSLAEEFDKEALRVIRTSPKWKPAVLKGRPVRSYYYIPISFTIH